jgi:pSer/pThr/pTyr-binding forkhead associated (FHA) protein
VFCTRCGQQNPEDARFCSRCGAPLVRPGEPVRTEASALEQTSTVALGGLTTGTDEPVLGDDVRQAAAALPVGAALLVVTHGPNAGSRFLLDQPVTTAGRHPDSDIFLDDVTVSRRHAELRRDDHPQAGLFHVHDVGSLNGTYLNRERIDDARLSPGDEVQIGKFRLVFLAPVRDVAAGEGGTR